MHDIFDALLHAPAGFSGMGLVLTVALAEWAVWLGPATLAYLWVFGAPRDRDAALAAGVAGVVALLIAAILSPILAVPRPFVGGAVANLLHHPSDGSFPSDHATLAFALAFGLRGFRPARLRNVWMTLVAVAVAVGWARVFLGAHHPTDILGGAAVGAIAVRITMTKGVLTLLSRLGQFGEAIRSIARIGAPSA